MRENDHHPLLAQTTLFLFKLKISGFLVPLFQPVSIIVTAIDFVLLFRMEVICSQFRTGAILEIVALAVSLLLTSGTEGIWIMIRTILVQGLTLLGTYFEFTAFSAILKEDNPSLSEKWVSVRNGYLIVNIITEIGIELFAHFNTLSSIILLGAAIASFAVDILIIIFYWKTYKTYQN